MRKLTTISGHAPFRASFSFLKSAFILVKILEE
jgi:hypothetical protein